MYWILKFKPSIEGIFKEILVLFMLAYKSMQDVPPPKNLIFQLQMSLFIQARS